MKFLALLSITEATRDYHENSTRMVCIATNEIFEHKINDRVGILKKQE
jgi:hypothetical protein